MPLRQSVKKFVFDRLAEVTKAVKTSNSTPKCMWILERGELRSKAKSLTKQPHPSRLRRATFPRGEGYTSSVKNQRFLPPSPQGEGFVRNQ